MNIWKILTLAALPITLAILGYAAYQLYTNHQSSVQTTKQSDGKIAKQQSSAIEAMKALNKLHAGTEVGISKSEYSKLLIESKAAVNQANSELPNSELKQSLNLAMEGYTDASLIWEKGGTDEALLACDDKMEKPEMNPNTGPLDKFLDGMCNPEITKLAVKYNIPRSRVFNDIDLIGIKKDVALTLIWNASKQHIDRASVLVNQ